VVVIMEEISSVFNLGYFLRWFFLLLDFGRYKNGKFMALMVVNQYIGVV
jgi:hypothetical protein